MASLGPRELKPVIVSARSIEPMVPRAVPASTSVLNVWYWAELMFIMTRLSRRRSKPPPARTFGRALRARAVVARRVGRARRVQQRAHGAVLLGELGLQQVRAQDLAQRVDREALHDDYRAPHVARLLVVLLVEAVADVDQPGP